MKIFVFLICALFMLPFKSSGQNMKPEAIVQDQLEAYNSRDLSKFISFYSSDIEIYNFRDSKPFIHGKKDLEKVYKQVFDNSPQLKATIDNRIVFENKVIDYEKVTGRKGIDLIEVVAIYELKENLIYRVTFIRKDK